MRQKTRHPNDALTASPFRRLPSELLPLFFSYLPIHDLLTTKQVCRLFAHRINTLLTRHPEILYASKYDIEYSYDPTGFISQPNRAVIAIDGGTFEQWNYESRLIDGGLICQNRHQQYPVFYAISADQVMTFFTPSGAKVPHTIQMHNDPCYPQCVDLLGRDTFVRGDRSGRLVVGPTDTNARQEQDDKAEKKTPRFRLFQNTTTAKKERRFRLVKKKPIASTHTVTQPERQLTHFNPEHQAPIVRVLGLNANGFISFDASGVIKYWDVGERKSIRTLHANEPIVSGEYCDANSVYYVTLNQAAVPGQVRLVIKQFDGTTQHTQLDYRGRAFFAPERDVVRYHIRPDVLIVTVMTDATNHIYRIQRQKTSNLTLLLTVHQSSSEARSRFYFFAPSGESLSMSQSATQLKIKQPSRHFRPSCCSKKPVFYYLLRD